MLSKLASSPLRQLVVRRLLSSKIGGPPVAAKQLVIPVTESGFFKYERNISRDTSYSNPQLKGDTAIRFLIRRLGHAYEVYPLIILTGLWFCVFLVATYISFNKLEVWLDRSNEKAPWAWERIRGNYHKKQTLLFDLDGATHNRLPIMEALQDEMLEAAKKRGTRS
uniref:Conserved plasma membrane protein n=1 Tax=Rhabditophanes sp. KR3021 TaxID=114890 RepID=A0AC35UEL5_9BILA